MSLRMFLKEGGNALKSTKPIQQDNVKPTVQSFYDDILSQIGIHEDDFVVIGSAGMRHPDEYSGDIDIAISIEALGSGDLKQIESRILALDKVPSMDTREMSGINVLSIAWPIQNQSPDTVQIDIMPSRSLQWSEWAYHSPYYKDSGYRGLFRNELLFAMAKYTNMNVLSRDDNGLPLEWNRLFFDLSKGLLTGTQSRIGKTGTLKNPYTKDKTLMTNDPNEVVALLFGTGFNKEDARTFEQVLSLLTTDGFLQKENLIDVLEMTKAGIINKDQEVPEILLYELEKLL